MASPTHIHTLPGIHSHISGYNDRDFKMNIAEERSRAIWEALRTFGLIGKDDELTGQSTIRTGFICRLILTCFITLFISLALAGGFLHNY